MREWTMEIIIVVLALMILAAIGIDQTFETIEKKTIVIEKNRVVNDGFGYKTRYVLDDGFIAKCDKFIVEDKYSLEVQVNKFGRTRYILRD